MPAGILWLLGKRPFYVATAGPPAPAVADRPQRLRRGGGAFFARRLRRREWTNGLACGLRAETHSLKQSLLVRVAANASQRLRARASAAGGSTGLGHGLPPSPVRGTRLVCQRAAGDPQPKKSHHNFSGSPHIYLSQRPAAAGPNVCLPAATQQSAGSPMLISCACGGFVVDNGARARRCFVLLHPLLQLCLRAVPECGPITRTMNNGAAY